MGLRQALADNEFRKAGAVGLEQLLQVTRRHALTIRDHDDTQVSVLEMGNDVRLDGLQPYRANSAVSRKLPSASHRSECDSCKIVDVSDGGALQFGRRQRAV